MKLWLTAVLLALLAGPACALDIVQALDRGQRVQLEQCEQVPETTAEAVVLREDLAKVLAAEGLAQPVTLRVARCAALIQVLAGGIVVHPAVAQWSEGGRLFVLAHELGHIRHADWTQLTELFRTEVPPDSSDEEVARLLPQLQPRLQRLMHGFEYAADAYAATLLNNMGRDAEADALDALSRSSYAGQSPTHPSAPERLARLLKPRAP